MAENQSDITTPPDDPEVDNTDTPLTDEEFERGRIALLARKARAATGLSQTAFATRYGIPAASLQEWEQGRRLPDTATQSYLRVISLMPQAIADALNPAA